MLRALMLGFGGLLATPPSSAAVDAEHAFYLAQRYALVGEIAEATARVKEAGGARPSCRVVVKLQARGVSIPICGRSEPPAPIASRVDLLLLRAGSAQPAAAVRFLEEARALDPFDTRLVPPLVRALRALGRAADARRVEAQARDLWRGRPVLWAGTR
jgi:hypothetical protein